MCFDCGTVLHGQGRIAGSDPAADDTVSPPNILYKVVPPLVKGRCVMWLELGSTAGGKGTFLWVCRCGSREIDFYFCFTPEEESVIAVGVCRSCLVEQKAKLPRCGRQYGRNK